MSVIETSCLKGTSVQTPDPVGVTTPLPVWPTDAGTTDKMDNPLMRQHCS